MSNATEPCRELSRSGGYKLLQARVNVLFDKYKTDQKDVGTTLASSSQLPSCHIPFFFPDQFQDSIYMFIVKAMAIVIGSLLGDLVYTIISVVWTADGTTSMTTTTNIASYGLYAFMVYSMAPAVGWALSTVDKHEEPNEYQSCCTGSRCNHRSLKPDPIPNPRCSFALEQVLADDLRMGHAGPRGGIRQCSG